MANIKLLSISTLEEKVPVHALASKTDLVIIKYGKEISVLYGRCHHRGALLGDGYVDGENLICGLHGWDYRYDTGISEYNNDEKLHKFTAIIDGDTLSVSQKEIEDFDFIYKKAAVTKNKYFINFKEKHKKNFDEDWFVVIKEKGSNKYRRLFRRLCRYCTSS